MKLFFSPEATRTQMLALNAVRSMAVTFTSETGGVVSGLMGDLDVSEDGTLIAMIRPPANDDWTSSEFGPAVPCVLSEHSEIYVH